MKLLQMPEAAGLMMRSIQNFVITMLSRHIMILQYEQRWPLATLKVAFICIHASPLSN
jgi:hypothetical protein